MYRINKTTGHIETLEGKEVYCVMGMCHTEQGYCVLRCAAFELDPDGGEAMLHCCKREIVIKKGE